MEKSKKISNLKNAIKSVFVKQNKKIFIGLRVLFVGVLIAVTFSALSESEEIKHVEFESDGWKSQTPGSWHIDKSADWIEVNKARVIFEVNSTPKMTDNKKDIILILDESGSMDGDKIEKVKSDATELVEKALSDGQNRVAIIKFDTHADVLLNFTDNKSLAVDAISSLSSYGNTNYTDALRKINNVLENYEKKDDTDLVALFLSDGYPCEETPNQIAEYAIVKDNYPYLTINAIQYEISDEIIKELKEISDYQYSAYMSTLHNILFEASSLTEAYDKFIITDFVDERYFELGTIDNVSVSIGTASLSIENGMEKITWDLGDNYRTGSKATMTLDVNLKSDVVVNENTLLPTNRKEDVEFKISDEPEEIIHENVTPRLKTGYKVIYDANTPVGCNIINPTSEYHKVFDLVTTKDVDLNNKCSGYLFKGWEMEDNSSEDINKLSDTTFVMPSHDVIIRGTWTKLSVSKSMTGDKSAIRYIMPFTGDEGFLDNTQSDYVTSNTGIDFTDYPSSTNGKGLYVRSGTENDEYPIFYYRGEINNNNVLFANKCWKIVRTTETGGTKLIYNGLPNANNANGICSNTGVDSQLTTVPFNSNRDSLAYSGYMTGTIYTNYTKTMTVGSSMVYGSSISYSGGTYVLGSPKTVSWTSNADLSATHYTCFSSSSSCTTVYYIYYINNNVAYYITLSNGKVLNDALNEMLTNNLANSNVKTYLENTWFAGSSGINGFSNYLEDTIWCNNRSIGLPYGWISGGTTSRSDSFYFGSTINNMFMPNLGPRLTGATACPNKSDRFTVSDTINGNGNSQYKVGLLTLDEVMVAGYSDNSYLVSGKEYWTLTPYVLNQSVVRLFAVSSGGKLGVELATSPMGVRPVISLNFGIIASSGDGSVSNPYRVD